MKLQVIKRYKVFIIILLFCSTSVVYAQNPRGDKVWHQGKIILVTNDTIKGLIKYNFLDNYIEFKNGKDYRKLLPNNFKVVSYRSVLDSSLHTLEVFDVQTSKNYFRPYFFEVEDTTGKIKIYKQYYWEQKTIVTNINTLAYGYGIRFVFYNINTKGHATYINPKKKYVLKLLKDKQGEVKRKVKEMNWKYSEPFDLKQILKYYNSLFT